MEKKQEKQNSVAIATHPVVHFVFAGPAKPEVWRSTKWQKIDWGLTFTVCELITYFR